MYKPGYIIIGLVVLVALATSPLWVSAVFGESAAPPELVYPTGYDQCILPTEYMNHNHMDVLNEWRDKVVRENVRMAEYNGQMMEMSLSYTCMKCHDNKADFCDRCHDYLDVNPYCWECHVAPEDAKQTLTMGGKQ
ncbi:MAG: sulfate reduction electron transfer complex DsrMKJOP subunit DsrJ [Candidatus Kapaibacterium sp.]